MALTIHLRLSLVGLHFADVKCPKDRGPLLLLGCAVFKYLQGEI